jgi:hypothetical protein
MNPNDVYRVKLSNIGLALWEHYCENNYFDGQELMEGLEGNNLEAQFIHIWNAVGSIPIELVFTSTDHFEWIAGKGEDC